MNCSALTQNGSKCKQKAVEDGRCRAHLSKTCAVCLEEVKRTDKKLRCGHMFHPKCIMQWFETSIECPQCRMEQDDDPLVVFRKHVEENIRERYREAVRSLQDEVRMLEAQLARVRRA